MKTCVLLVLVVFQLSSVAPFLWKTEDYDPNADPTDYGVDVSFPMHHPIKGNLQSINPVKKMFAERYEEHINGCYKKFSFRECDANERARFEMSIDQPSHQHNYTDIGFKKMMAPEHIYKPIKEFYDNYKAKKKLEMWPRGNTYVNNWHSPTYMVNFEDPRFQPEGFALKDSTWNNIKPIVEEWVGAKVKPSSLYGVRIYESEAVLATHVDRLPLVSSCIIQIDQDLDEPWPIEVIGHDGKAYNVTMKPGEMVLYESHTVLHGRPFPLKGRSYVNVFVHFIPEGHDEKNRIEQRDLKQGRAPTVAFGGHEADNHDEATLAKHLVEHDVDNRKKLRRVPGEGEAGNDNGNKMTGGQTPLHVAAARGDMKAMEELLGNYVPGTGEDVVNAKDDNGWMPIHEACRWGNLDAVKYLFSNGADLSADCNSGTPLEIARESKKDNVVKYLLSRGAAERSIPQEEET
jgi:prolyl 4-hydroxylase